MNGKFVMSVVKCRIQRACLPTINFLLIDDFFLFIRWFVTKKKESQPTHLKISFQKYRFEQRYAKYLRKPNFDGINMKLNLNHMFFYVINQLSNGALSGATHPRLAQ